MPYLVTTRTWPSDKTAEAVKKTIEVVKKFPPDESLGEPVVPASVKATERGIQSIGISLAKEGKLEEALSRTIQSMVMYHDIEGYEYSVEVQFTVYEALAFIGMGTSE